MEHKEYKRINKDASIAVLFIHGIVGTPNHFSWLLPLVPPAFSVYNMLLDGHGKGVKDFSKTSMKKWEAQAAAAVKELSQTHKEIYIVAHSMGTLLAMEQAINNPQVTQLFLLASPLSVFLKPKMMVNAGKIFLDNIRPDDFEALTVKSCYGIAGDKNPFHYIGWIPRYLELFAKIRQTRKRISFLKTPCTVYQSKKDEMVANKSVKYLSRNPHISLHILENSGHFAYGEEDRTFLITEFHKMLGSADTTMFH